MENTQISRILSEYHNATVTHLLANEEHSNYDHAQGDHYDSSQELVIDMLATLGVTPDFDRDEAGQYVSDDVQTLLTLAAFRFPRLQILFQYADQAYTMHQAALDEGESYNKA